MLFRSGFYCIEGDGIKLKNVKLLTTKDETLIHVSNSKNLTFDNIGFSDKVKTIIHLNGNRTEKVRLLNTNTTKLQQGIVLGEGVSNKVLTLK